jgi:hypothetical protein
MSELKARPIIMSGWSVQHILADEKTMTRRPIKPQAHSYNTDILDPWVLYPREDENDTFGNPSKPIRCPYGKPGGFCYVKETHYRWTGCGVSPSHWIKSPDGDRYNARGYIGERENDALHDRSAASVKIPSIFMPRWASRLPLRINDIRIEQLQKITPQDCEREGITGKTLASPVRGQPYEIYSNQDGLEYTSPVEAFRALWNSIYAKPKPKTSRGEITHYESYPWSEADRDPRETIKGKPHYCYFAPFVWVLTFERV